jgi:hypothetical protein
MEAVAKDDYVELTPVQREHQMCEYQLRDTHRRIENIIRVCPAAEWTLEEARAVLATLSGIVRVRQGDGELHVAVTITQQSGNHIEASTRVPHAGAK